MAITSEIIGKLGGAEVEVIPVSISAMTEGEHVLASIEVPAGERVLVSLVGNFSSTQLDSRRPDFMIGGERSGTYPKSGNYGSASGVLEASGNASLYMTSGTGTTAFTGHVYTVKM